MIHRITINSSTKTSKILFFNEMDLDTLPDPRIVPLFGTNGVGKSTLLEALANCTLSREYFFAKSAKMDDVEATSIHPCNFLLFYPRDISRNNMRGIDFVDFERIKTGRTIKIEIDNDYIIKKEYFNSIDNFKSGYARVIGEEEQYRNRKRDIEGNSEGQSILISIFDWLDQLNNIPKEHMGVLTDGKKTLYLILLDEIDSGLSVDNIDIVMEKIKSIMQTLGDNVQIFMSFNNPRVLKHFPFVLSMYDGKVKEMHTDEDMLREIKANMCMFDRVRKDKNGNPIIHDNVKEDYDFRGLQYANDRQIEEPEPAILIRKTKKNNFDK